MHPRFANIIRDCRFIRDRSGAAAAEFALISVIFAGTLLAILDVGRAFYEYNRAYKACQVGVRFAVVNDMADVGMASYDGIVNGGLTPGAAIPAGTVSPNIVTCSGTAVSASCTGGIDQAAYDRIRAKMAAHYPELINNANAVVSITYEHIGLGFAGNPLGPDVWPLTTVSISGLQFDFTTPLLSPIFGTMSNFPSCSAAMTGEDFTT